jgi:hypothetical protein
MSKTPASRFGVAADFLAFAVFGYNSVKGLTARRATE